MRYLKIILFVFTALPLPGWAQESTTDTISLYKSFIENQKRIETEEQEFENPYCLSEKDLLVALPLIKKGLCQYGYRDMPDAEFAERVKEIFGIDILYANSTSPYAILTKVRPEYTTLFIEKMDGEKSTLTSMEFDLPVYTRNIFISLKYHLITEMPLLKDIITITRNNGYEIKFRHINVVHKNKYLFNDEQDSRTWLMKNDPEFVERWMNHNR